MFRKIMLVSTSGDADAPAVQRVLALAAVCPVEIEVFDPVYEPALEAYYGSKEVYEPVRGRLLEARLEAARKVAARLRAEGHEASADAVWEQRVDRAVARRVVERGIDLVVTEPLDEHRSGLSHADWRLVAMCPVPVLIVKGGAGRYRKIVAAVDPFHAHAKPAELDRAILAHAKALQGLFNTDLRIVHCFVPLSQLGTGVEADLPLKEAERALEDATRATLAELVAEAGLPVSAIRLTAGRPEAVLAEIVRRGEGDLVIIGALSRSGLKGLLIGSTAERFLRRSDTDVLMVNPPGMSFAV